MTALLRLLKYLAGISVGLLLLSFQSGAQKTAEVALPDSAVTVTPMYGIKLGTTQRAANFPQKNESDPFHRARFEEKIQEEPEVRRKRPPVINARALPHGKDPLLAPLQTRGVAPKVKIGFVIEGINDNNVGKIPVPDPNGEIGRAQYIQMTNGDENSYFSIYDRQGNNIKPPTSVSNFWKSFNLTGFNDPIVLYDQTAKRWLMSEISENSILAAISATDDPMGVWNSYQFKTPSSGARLDFPKWGVWNNSYYVTTNEDGKLPIYLINRSQLLAGAAVVDVQRVTIPKFFNQEIFQVAAPIDWDGETSPNANTPMAVARIYDDAWDLTGYDRLEIWSIYVDWTDYANTKVHSLYLRTAPFNSVLCNADIYTCLYQPTGQSLEAGEGVLNNRVQYRNFGDHESVVLNHVVDITGGRRAGIRWYELRKSGGADWSIYQQGTYPPDTATALHRFMASIAMNGVGDIALGYSAFGDSLKPSLFVTGRKATDPLGQMTAPETRIGLGLSYYTGNRWGDYADMTVDPLDDRTFWFTGEYTKARSAWATKIASFTIDYPTPTVDLADVWDVRISPNPANSDLTVQFSGDLLPDPIGYQIVNELGVPMLSGIIETSGKDFQKTIALSALPTGLYFIHFHQGALVKTFKFVKQD